MDIFLEPHNFGHKVLESQIFHFSQGSRSKCIIASEESQCHMAHSLDSTYSTQSFEGIKAQGEI